MNESLLLQVLNADQASMLDLEISVREWAVAREGGFLVREGNGVSLDGNPIVADVWRFEFDQLSITAGGELLFHGEVQDLATERDGRTSEPDQTFAQAA